MNQHAVQDTASNFSFNAILTLAHEARTKRLTDNEILQVMTRLTGHERVNTGHVEAMVSQVMIERNAQ